MKSTKHEQLEAIIRRLDKIDELLMQLALLEGVTQTEPTAPKLKLMDGGSGE